MNGHLRVVAIALVSLVITSCNKGNNPVNPTPSTGILLVAGGDFADSSLIVATILKCDVLIDGTSVGSASFGTPNSAAILTGSLMVGSGQHTIAFRIITQTSSPNPYQVFGATYVVGNATNYLPDKRQRLATGESIVYAITI